MHQLFLLTWVLVWVSHPKALDSLTLEKALSLASESHPGLEANRRAVSVREAGLSQAGRGLNPEISLEVEDVAGTGKYKGTSAAQSTVQISQTLEWGGKRGRRKQVAATEKNLAERELERKRIEVRALTFGHFMEALHAQRRLALALEAVTLSERLLETVSHRVKEGAASTADEIRAHLAVSEAKMEARQDTLRLESTKRRLALLWGEEKTIPPLRDELDSLRIAPPLEELYRKISSGPIAASKTVNVQLAEARLNQQSSLSSPDMTLNAGLRHMAEPGDLALVGGVSMPLPFMNRNQGGRESAKQEVHQAKAAQRETLLELKSMVGEIHKNLILTREEIETLRSAIIPDAVKAATVLEEGYRRGRFGMLEVLNAESDLFRYQLRHLESLLQYQLGYAELERLIGSEEKEN